MLGNIEKSNGYISKTVTDMIDPLYKLGHTTQTQGYYLIQHSRSESFPLLYYFESWNSIISHGDLMFDSLVLQLKTGEAVTSSGASSCSNENENNLG